MKGFWAWMGGGEDSPPTTPPPALASELLARVEATAAPLQLAPGQSKAADDDKAAAVAAERGVRVPMANR